MLFVYIQDTSPESSSSHSSPLLAMGLPSPGRFRRSAHVTQSPSAHCDLIHYARPHPLPNHRPMSVAVMDTISELPWDGLSDFGVVKPDVFDLGPLREALEAELCKSECDGMTSRAAGLDDVLRSLKAMLEDYQGQYEELQKLEEQVHALYTMIKVRPVPIYII